MEACAVPDDGVGAERSEKGEAQKNMSKGEQGAGGADIGQIQAARDFIDRRNQIAEKFDLDMDLFAGVIYRVTLKSRMKIKASEDAIEFGKRLLDYIEVKDIFIPFDDLDPEESYLNIIEAQERAMQIRDHGAEPEKNYASCEAWFRPCNYFSKCHGHLNTDGGKLYPPRTHWNMFPYVENKTDKELEDLGL